MPTMVTLIWALVALAAISFLYFFMNLTGSGTILPLHLVWFNPNNLNGPLAPVLESKLEDDDDLWVSWWWSQCWTMAPLSLIDRSLFKRLRVQKIGEVLQFELNELGCFLVIFNIKKRGATSLFSLKFMYDSYCFIWHLALFQCQIFIFVVLHKFLVFIYSSVSWYKHYVECPMSYTFLN